MGTPNQLPAPQVLDGVAVEPIERPRVSELLAENLLVRIADGVLPPGRSVPTERELTEAFRVGRSSVREALRILESRGLIEADGRGRFVVSAPANPLHRSLQLLLTLEAVDHAELFEVRNILEVESAGLAAARRSASELVALAAAVDDMDAGMGSAERYIEADLRFHVGIAQATGNRIAAHLMHAIRDVLARALTEIFRIPGSPESSLDQHRRILEAIVDRDAEAARRRMREHLVKVEGDLRAALGPVEAGQAPKLGPLRTTGGHG